MAYIRCGEGKQRSCNGTCYDPATEEPDMYIDCNGTCGGSWKLDCQGNCYNPATQTPSVVKDCLGVCGGSAQLGCDGICNSGKYKGCDGVCDSGWKSDCLGVCYDPGAGLPANAPDCNNVCNGTSFFDCSGVCNGDAYFDCGQNCISPTCNNYRIKSSRNWIRTEVKAYPKAIAKYMKR